MQTNSTKDKTLKTLKRLLLLAAVVLVPGLAKAQNVPYHDIILAGNPTRPVAGASVTICSAGATGIPCTPTVSIFSTAGGGALANPTTTDVRGNLNFFIAPGSYVASVSGTGLVSYNYNFSVGSTSGGGSVGGSTTQVQYNNSGVIAGASGVTTDGSNLHIKGPAPFADVTSYGARSVLSVPQSTATCTNTSPNVTLAAASLFQNGDGITLYGCGPTVSLSTPAAPSVTPSIAIMGTGLGGGTVNHSTVASGTGSSTYQYEVFYRDKVGGLTAPSSATTITNGLSTLGAVSCTVSTATRSNASITMNFSSACAGAVAGARFSYFGSAIGDFNGWYNVSVVNSSTQIVLNNLFIDSRSLGWQPNDGATTTGGTAVFYLSNHLNLTYQTGMWEAYICAERPGDVTFKLIGVTKPSTNGGIQDTQFDDYGSPYNDNQTYPTYVTNSQCNGGSALPDPLTTTIVSGAGTTSLVLANAASNNSSGRTAIFDDGPGIAAAASAIAGFSASLYFPPPTQSSGFYPIYSYTTLPSGISVKQAGNIQLYETLQTADFNWDGSWSEGGVPAFFQTGAAGISVVNANPGIYSTTSTQMHNVSISIGGTNGGTGVIDDTPATGNKWDHVAFAFSGSTGQYLGMAIVIRMTDPAADSTYIFTDSLFANAATAATALPTPIIYTPPGQNGSGGLNSGTFGAYNFARTNFALAGVEFEGCPGAPIIYFDGARSVRQAGYMPLFAAGNCTGGTSVSGSISNITLDTDVDGVLNLEQTGGFLVPNIELDNVAANSSAGGSNGPTPLITGHVSSTSTGQVVTGPGTASGRQPSISGFGACPGPSLLYAFCLNEGEVIQQPNGFIYSPLQSPSGLTATIAAGGSLPSAATLQFSVTAVDVNGKETILSPISSSVTTSGSCPSSGNCEANLSWTAPATSGGPLTYNVYACGVFSVCPSMRIQTFVGITGTSVTVTSTSGGAFGGGNPGLAGQSGLSPTNAWAPTSYANSFVANPKAFSALSACSSTTEGSRATVSDSTTAVWGATITGSGSTVVQAFCNGTNWIVTGAAPTPAMSWATPFTSCGTIAAGGACSNTTSSAGHCIAGIATLSGGSSTITGLSPSFTSSSSFFVTTNDLTTITNASKGVPASATTITFTGTGTDNISFIACGT